MRTVNIELYYRFEGKELRFPLDLTNSTDQERIIKTLDWASRRDVPVYIERPMPAIQTKAIAG